MILNFLKEDLDNPTLQREYTKNYSFVPEEDFLTIVKMDPNSYPKNGKEFDLTKEPIKVGNIASGSGLLLRCYKNGERDFLKDFKRVQDACLKFTNNRSQFEIKNAGQFQSVSDFVNYVENDGNVEINVSDATQGKKKQTVEDKLELLRQKQFPKIQTLAELMAIADLDEESDIEHGQIGNVARNLLLPHYAAGERDFLNKKVSLKKAIAKYYNSDAETIKSKPLKSYETVKDFIMDFIVVTDEKNNLLKLLRLLADLNGPLDDRGSRFGATGYQIVGQTSEYDLIRYANQYVGCIIDRCDYPADALAQAFNLTEKSSDDEKHEAFMWLRDNISYSGPQGTNHWCTGWSYPSSTASSHANSSNNGVLIAIIKRNRVPYQAECDENWQVAFYGEGRIDDIEQGNNYHTQPQRNQKRFFEEFLPSHPDIIGYLMQFDCIARNAKFQDAANLCGITKAKKFDKLSATLNWSDDEVEVELEPLHYSGPNSVEQYVENNELSGPNNISEIIVEEGITAIPNFAFQDFTSLKKVKFPESLKVIGHKAFSGCESLVRVVLPPNLEEIGMGAFEACASLRGSIRLPVSLKKIGQKAFANYLVGDFSSSVSQRLKFTLSPKRLDTNVYPEPLLVSENEAMDYVNKISISDN